MMLKQLTAMKLIKALWHFWKRSLKELANDCLTFRRQTRS